MPHRLLEPLAEAGALSYLYLHMQQPAVAGLSIPDPTPERIAYVLGLALFAGFYGGKIYRDFLSTRRTQDREQIELKDIAKMVANIERRLDANKSDVEKDLIVRRAVVDKEITVLNMGVVALERRAAMSESRHNKLRDAFNRLTGLVSPILKDADLDLTRSDVVSKIIGTAHSLPDEVTDEGNET